MRRRLGDAPWHGGSPVLLIECPWCGPRDQSEFSWGGEAGNDYPHNPETLTDSEWSDYLFMRHNVKGVQREQWVHVHGCRRWFIVERDTVSYRITGSFGSGAAPREGEP
jgi:sarcosine oxidase, subunit delta